MLRVHQAAGDALHLLRQGDYLCLTAVAIRSANIPVSTESTNTLQR